MHLRSFLLGEFYIVEKCHCCLPVTCARRVVFITHKPEGNNAWNIDAGNNIRAGRVRQTVVFVPIKSHRFAKHLFGGVRRGRHVGSRYVIRIILLILVSRFIIRARTRKKKNKQTRRQIQHERGSRIWRFFTPVCPCWGFSGSPFRWTPARILMLERRNDEGGKKKPTKQNKTYPAEEREREREAGGKHLGNKEDDKKGWKKKQEAIFVLGLGGEEIREKCKDASLERRKTGSSGPWLKANQE